MYILFNLSFFEILGSTPMAHKFFLFKKWLGVIVSGPAGPGGLWGGPTFKQNMMKEKKVKVTKRNKKCPLQLLKTLQIVLSLKFVIFC